MEVSEVLKKAWSAVEDAGLPDEVRPIGFREAVRLIAPVSDAPVKSRGPAGAERHQTRAGAGSASDSAGDDAGIVASEDEIYDRVVAHTGADRGRLEQLVHLDDGVLRVSLPGLRLGANNAERTRAVAQLLTITRGFGLEENETSVEIVRAECVRLKVYDSANFSSHISKLNGYVVGGSGQNRRLRAKSPGVQGFAALVESLIPES
jgi:hypothetical protein